MAKRCPEEFNPWPPFVDIFASVILVMLLFLLITIVNIGYYAQFKFKTSHTASTVTKAPIQPEDQSKVTSSPQVKCIPIENEKKSEKESRFSFHKVIAEINNKSNNSLFEGGKAEGNAVSYAVNKNQKEFKKQKLIQKDLTLTIAFEDVEIFINSSIKRQIKRFVGDIHRRSKRAVFTLYVNDPTNILSSTIAKQISLGRVLNVKNIINHSRTSSKNIKMNLQYDVPSSNPYGDIVIKVHIP